jgi:ABC-2 type transport system ATP-binding protein
MYAVETQNLVKQYGKTYALKGLNFTVNPQEIMVLLGPNGSGKTTLLLTLATVLKPTSGTAKVMGFDVVKHPTSVRQILGISFQDARGFWRHKPAEILQFHAAMCGIKKSERKALIEQVLREMELWDARNKLFMQLSGGQAKRLEVSKVLVQNPKFAIFDEPSSQVDLRGKRTIWDKILGLREKGVTLLVATNEVREAEYLADRVTILDQGQSIVCDTVQNLKDKITGGDIVELELERAENDVAFQEELARLPGTVKVAPVDNSRYKVYVSMAEAWVPKMTNLCYQREIRVSSVRVTEPSLDDVFLSFTGKKLESNENA